MTVNTMNENTETRDMLAQSVELMLSRHHSVNYACEGKPAPDLWPHLVEIGLTAAERGEAHGGLSLSFTDTMPAFREFGRALAVPYASEFIVVGGWLLETCDSELCALAASGDARVALAHREHGDGGELSFTHCRAERTAQGWALNGRKTLVIGGGAATHIIVPALITSESQELGLFLIPTNTAGLTVLPSKLYDGSTAADFTLTDTIVSSDALLCSGARASELVELAIDRARAALCNEAVGLVERVHDITLDYVKTRQQFGQPIGAFQTMQHRMADMAMEIELVRSCAQIATDAIDQGGDPRDRMRTISAAMIGLCASVRRVGQSSVQAHGGIALTQEYSIGHFFKRLTLLERVAGNGDFHLDRYLTLAHA